MTKAGPDYIKLELAMLKADRGYLKAVTAAVRERLGRLVSSAVLRGHPVAQTLAMYSDELGADLVVMTSHGRGGLRRAWLGSVTDQLIRSREVPVLVVRPGEVVADGHAWEAGEILVVSGQTHLVGTIIDGVGKGQRVETNSRLLNFGPNGALSDIDGNMVIVGERAR